MTTLTFLGGNVIIPAFIVVRSQDLIYRLGKLHREGVLPQQYIYLIAQ